MPIGCDCEPALWNVFGNEQVNTSMSGFNLIKTIKAEMQFSTITWSSRHVRGHQDKLKTFEELDRWERANVEADTRAKDYWEWMQDEEPPRWPHSPLSEEGWAMYHEGLPVESKLDEIIHEWAMAKSSTAYWIEKGRLAPATEEEVQWAWLGSAMKGTLKGRQMWATKHFSGWEATGIKMKQRGLRDTDQCPRCTAQEGHRHVVQCPTEGAKLTFKKILQPVQSWLQRTTAPDIQDALITAAEAYRTGRSIPTKTTWHRATQRAVRQQNRLGNNALMEGLWVEDWQYAHQGWLDTKGRDTCSKRWTIQILRKLILVSWDMWQARNRLVHQDQDTRQKLIINTLNKRVRTLHQIGRTQVLATPGQGILPYANRNETKRNGISKANMDTTGPTHS